MASDFDFDLTIWNSYPSSTFNSSSKEQPSLFSLHRIQNVRPSDLSSQLAARMSEAEALGESLVRLVSGNVSIQTAVSLISLQHHSNQEIYPCDYHNPRKLFLGISTGTS
jgi:hypothetical protein